MINMTYQLGDIVVGTTNNYLYTHVGTYWMVAYSFKTTLMGTTFQRLRLVGTTHENNKDLEFFKEYVSNLLGNYKRWSSGFNKEARYSMIEEMKEWMRQYDKYLEYDFLGFEVDPADFQIVKPFVQSNKDGISSLYRLGD